MSRTRAQARAERAALAAAREEQNRAAAQRAAVENGALAATQFHPEKSGDAGATVLRNWLRDVVG